MTKEVYRVIPFHSDKITINENDIVVFDNFEDAENYKNSLEGSPIVVNTPHVVDYYLREKDSGGFQGGTPTDGLSGFRG